MNPFLATDGYKVGHHKMYPKGTTLVYSNFTPRSNKHAPKGCDKVVSFGQQMVVRQIVDLFNEDFFWKNKQEVCQEVKREYELYLGQEYDVSHIERLWDRQCLPVIIKSLPEGTLVPMGIPVLTIRNTDPDFYWITNFLETLISNLLWKPMTSATIAFQYKKLLTAWANYTHKEALSFIPFQAHDFSMRGLDSISATISSGLGHAISFLGSDSLPVIHGARRYYGHLFEPVVHSVNATEHSVMCAGSKEGELETFRYLMNQFPTGILSIVSDTWDLWKVCTEILPALKEEILARDGKLVIRPDSGDPVDIICGVSTKYRDLSTYLPEGEVIPEYFEEVLLEEVGEDTPHGERGATEYENVYNVRGKLYKAKIHNISWNRHDKQYYFIDMWEKAEITIEELEWKPSDKGVIELLWDIFGGTVNEEGYKVLDPHIGAIYGDSITLDRAEQIFTKLESKGFASTNVVLGIGSYTYQYNTRDTFGFAMKATYVEINKTAREIFKDPITDDGTKKSAKGLLSVRLDQNNNYVLMSSCYPRHEEEGCLQVIFQDGTLTNQVTLSEIRNRLNEFV